MNKVWPLSSKSLESSKNSLNFETIVVSPPSFPHSQGSPRCLMSSVLKMSVSYILSVSFGGGCFRPEGKFGLCYSILVRNKKSHQTFLIL